MSSDNGALEVANRMKDVIALLSESNDHYIELNEKVEAIDERVIRLEKIVANIDADKLSYFNENFDEVVKDISIAVNIVNIERGMNSMVETGNKEIKPTGIIAKQVSASGFKPKTLKMWYTDRMNDENDIVNIPTGMTFRKWVVSNKAFKTVLKPNASEKEIIDSSFRYMESARPGDYAKLKERHEEYKNALKIAYQESKGTQM
jgi:hypothetical protein